MGVLGDEGEGRRRRQSAAKLGEALSEYRRFRRDGGVPGSKTRGAGRGRRRAPAYDGDSLGDAWSSGNGAATVRLGFGHRAETERARGRRERGHEREEFVQGLSTRGGGFGVSSWSRGSGSAPWTVGGTGKTTPGRICKQAPATFSFLLFRSFLFYFSVFYFKTFSNLII